MTTNIENAERDYIFLRGLTAGSLLTEPLPLTRDAIAFATLCHKGEIRQNGEPFIVHPLRSCNILVNLRVTNDSFLASGVLHDVLEHERTTLKIIKNKFDSMVAKLVDALTKKPGEITEQYFKRVESEIGSILGKGADRLDNITTMMEVYDLERADRYVIETKTFILPMLKRARDYYPEYSNALVMLYVSINSMIKLAESNIMLQKKLNELSANP
jgi:(p)ppGpp synthase/HD superfamily hydrolase